MNYKEIDLNTYKRKEHFKHYTTKCPCTYSTVVNLDITNLKNFKLYPTLLYLLTKTINNIDEFKTTSINDKLVIFDKMNPAYTIFNKESETFSSIYTLYNDDYRVFLENYHQDLKKYLNTTSFEPKKDRPLNTFDVSMIPWFTFTSFNINIYNDGKYLLPIFTFGKFFENNNQRFIPLAIQVHHAVCDGYHVGKFINTLQELINHFK
ncbi:MAG: CatA-like O-acetyltransferase [Bacilli bacterium]|nr:CatA-like O-acetyltransferase [Bacilli bacterium]